MSTTENKTPSKKSNAGIIGFFACSGCLVLLIAWIVAAFFIFSPAIGDYIDSFQDNNHELENYYEGLDYNANEEYLDNYSSNTNEEAPFFEDLQPAEISTVNGTVSFGVYENEKFIEPITIPSNQDIMLAARINTSVITDELDLSLSLYSNDETQVATSSEVTNDGRYSYISVQAPANSAEYYYTFKLFDGETEIESFIVALSYE